MPYSCLNILADRESLFRFAVARSTTICVLWLRTAVRYTSVRGVEMCPPIKKALFRALLSQLHPGRSTDAASPVALERNSRRGPEYQIARRSREGKGSEWICKRAAVSFYVKSLIDKLDDCLPRSTRAFDQRQILRQRPSHGLAGSIRRAQEDAGWEADVLQGLSRHLHAGVATCQFETRGPPT